MHNVHKSLHIVLCIYWNSVVYCSARQSTPLQLLRPFSCCPLCKVHLTCHPCLVDKMITSLTWELKTDGPALGWPPGLDIGAYGQENMAGHWKPGSLMNKSDAGLVFYFFFHFLLLLLCVMFYISQHPKSFMNFQENIHTKLTNYYLNTLQIIFH